MRVAIYAPVSTQKQETDMQMTDLRKYAARMEWEAAEYIEKASSVKRRPVLPKWSGRARPTPRACMPRSGTT